MNAAFEAWADENGFSIRHHAQLGYDSRYTRDAWSAWQACRKLAIAEFENIRSAGENLSNCAFNLAQRSPGEFAERDAKSLDEARKRWDLAVAARKVVR